MSTRRASPSAPFSSEKYMSSPEFMELRGVSGTAVAARTAILNDPELRRLLWALQSLSLEPGGLRKVAEDLVALYPERIGSPTMHSSGCKPGKILPLETLMKIHRELDIVPWEFKYSRDWRRAPDGEIRKELQDCEQLLECCRSRTRELEMFLYDLCVNPRLVMTTGETASVQAAGQTVHDEFPTVDLAEVREAAVPFLKDVVGALSDYQACIEKDATDNFVLTTIGRVVWETLDFALEKRRMVLVEGWEGRGKTEAVKAWCRRHRGEARFVSLKGIVSKTSVFREIAKVLGIASSYARTATEMQARIEDTLHRSRLMLVFDEAHFLFPQSPRIYARPELVDWLDTALCNHDVPCALITTPQFLNCVDRAESQVGWNWRQFRRRVRRWKVLPEWNTQEDLLTVAKKLLPGISRAGLKLAVGYAQTSLHGAPSRDVSGLGDVATEAGLIAEESGRREITFEDVERAINEVLCPSDTAFASRLAKLKSKDNGKRRRANPIPASLSPQAKSEPINDVAHDREGFAGPKLRVHSNQLISTSVD